MLTTTARALCQVFTTKTQSLYHPLLVTTISVRVVCHQVRLGVTLSMLMIPCGMVEVVVKLALAAHSTIHHGFVDNYLSQLMLVWKFDCVQWIRQLTRILQWNWLRFISNNVSTYSRIWTIILIQLFVEIVGFEFLLDHILSCNSYECCTDA